MFYFINKDIDFKLSGKLILKQWLNNLLTERGFSCGTINIIFLSDEDLLKLNISSLGHNYYTDIITFDYTEDFNKKKLIADLYISVDSVLKNSLLYEQPYPQRFESELCRVIVHGILHLIGENDITKVQKQKMRCSEDFELAKLSKYFKENKIVISYK